MNKLQKIQDIVRNVLGEKYVNYVRISPIQSILSCCVEMFYDPNCASEEDKTFIREEYKFIRETGRINF